MYTRLFNADCLDLMATLPAGSVDLVLTDPPYNIARSNNFCTMGRKGIDFGEWDKGFDLFTWIDACAKLVKPGGSLFYFNAWKNIGVMAQHCETLGFEVKDCFRWEKANPMPRNRDRRYIVDFELGVWAVKTGSRWTFNRQDKKFERPKFVSGLVSGKEKTEHTTQKPLALMEYLVKLHSNEGDTVLDPFMGSGTTGVACKNLNRNFIGIEKDEKYFEIAKARINAT